MTFIPKKIRLLPLSIAVVTALSFSTVAFATTYPTPYTTTTTYVGTSTVSVTSTISGASGTEQITFLVAKANPTTAADIIYIDQQAATSGSATFTFTTAATNLNATSTVKFGAGVTPAANIGPDVAASGIFNLSNPRVMSDPDYFTPDTHQANPDNNSVVTFGTISGVGASDTYGILLSTNKTGLSQTFTVAQVNGFLPNSSLASGGIKKLPALGKNGSNQFAIKLIDGGLHFINSSTTFYTRTYAIYNDGSKDCVSLGDVRTVDLTK